jgi:predicted dehydrogenase
MKSIKVGMIGAGAIAASQCKDINNHPRAEVIAVADTSRKRAAEIQTAFNLKQASADYRDLLRNPDIDAVIIALPNYLHAPVALAALKAGKHVMLDKPFAMNQTEALKVAAAAKTARKVCMVGMNQRFTVAAQTVKTFVDRGELGDIYHAKAYWLRRTGSPKFGTWFTQKKLAGGGALLDIGVHMLDLCLYLIGNFKPLAVSGAVYTKLGNRGLGEGGWGKSDPGKHIFDVDDLGVALIKLSGGVTVTLEASWARHQDTPNSNNVELVGTEAGAKVYPAATICRFARTPGEYEVVMPQDVKLKFPGGGSRGTNWIGVILGEAKQECTLQQSIAVQKILDAVYASSRTGREIRIK